MTLEELRQKREQILALAAQHGVSNVRVFGSVARGDAGPASDVDFLVDVVDLTRFAWGGGGLLVALEKLLNCPVDLVTLDDLHTLLRDRVEHEAAPL